jgi:AAA+ ATPase superfamily predicted ATPase
MEKKYPFKFLDSYNQNDTEMFFGRDEEIVALYEMVFQNSILLVYGASGTGKTSLIQCGLAGRFKSYEWLSLTIRRGTNINTALEKALTDAGVMILTKKKCCLKTLQKNYQNYFS